jgi:hypothetical protein
LKWFALLHLCGHIVVRTLQFLRAPSTLHATITAGIQPPAACRPRMVPILSYCFRSGCGSGSTGWRSNEAITTRSSNGCCARPDHTGLSLVAVPGEPDRGRSVGSVRASHLSSKPARTFGVCRSKTGGAGRKSQSRSAAGGGCEWSGGCRCLNRSSFRG